jgi:uncharacterized protein YecE (DUF72 family)
MGAVHIGLSGFSYRPWQGEGRFYPPGLKPADFLRYYAGRFTTVEMDGMWYRLPSPQTVAAWIEATPPGFIFAPKAHRQITHLQRLKPAALPHLQAMLERIAPLREQGRLGPVLLQLPPNLPRDDARLDAFLGCLPRNIRWAVEFRHASWRHAGVDELLRRYSVARAIAETDDDRPDRRDTAGFWYLRLRKGRYEEAELAAWGQWIREEMGKGRDCYVYFKHEDEGSPWIWANRLRELAGR